MFFSCFNSLLASVQATDIIVPPPSLLFNGSLNSLICCHPIMEIQKRTLSLIETEREKERRKGENEKNWKVQTAKS